MACIWNISAGTLRPEDKSICLYRIVKGRSRQAGFSAEHMHWLREKEKYIQNMLQLFNKKSNDWLKQTGFLLPTFMNSLVTELYVRWITSKRVQTCVTSLEIETHLCCCTGVVTRLTFIEVLKIKHTRDRSQVINIIMIINSSNNNYNVKEAKWCSRYEIATLVFKINSANC